MDISELKKELINGKIRPYYIFTGEELALQDIYINKISEISGLPVKRVDTVKEIFNRLFTKPLFHIDPVVFVIRNDDEFYKTKTIWKKMLDATSFRDNILILLYSGVEKSSEFCKQNDAVLTRFDQIGSSLLKNRLQAITQMPDQYCNDIVKMCGSNYGRIKNELYKLSMFAKCNGYSWNTAYLEAKKCNLIHEEIGDIIFDFTNSIVDRNIKKAYNLYPKILQTEDGSAIKLLSVLYNSFRNVLMVESTPFNERTEQVLGMTKTQIYITAQKCNRYNLFELVNIIKTIRYLEKGIKVGLVEEKFALPYLMGVIW